jgi:hypothetical protein
MTTYFPNLNLYRKKLILLTLAFLTSCIVSAQPVISSFSPESGPAGTTIIITGSNFNTTPSNNIVFFGAVKATVNTASGTTLSVTVPAGATYEPISVTVNGLTGYSAKPFGLTFSGGILTTNSFPYTTGVDYESNAETNDIATGDFDGDGKADIAIVDRLNNYVGVYKNNSTASTVSFSTKTIFTTGTQPVSLVAGDFDGDGKTDLAVTNKNDNTVSVFRNTGTPGIISFAAKTDFGTASTPLAIATGDFDGDGRTDIATANAALAPSYVSILKNTGSVGAISFATSNNITVPAPGSSIAVVDLNGDNKQDIVTASNSVNLMSVVINTSTTGVISFATAVSYATGTTPGGLALGDLDGDNKADITLSNFLSNTISIFRNTSSGGTFSLDTRNDIAISGADHIAITDVDGDGKPDLAVQTVSPNGFSILKNNSSTGAISFLTPLDYPSLCSSGIVAADWNGDGKTDLGIGCGVFRVGLFKNKTTEPQITSFTPTTAMPGETVTISGVNFSGTTAVSFGGTPAASFTVVNATTITAVIGTGASGDIIVSSPSGTSTKSGFTFTLPTPVITSFAPQSANQGTTVTINGTYFTGATAVTFGGVAATSFTVVNDGTITAVVGAGSSGNVFVTTPYGTALLAGFTFLPPPAITSFSPTLGGTGTVISIFGTNFTGATAVSFGGTPASSITIVSNTQINATVGTGASGDISVTTANGTGALSGFTYMAPPVITSFSPATANLYSTIIIKGSNLYRVTAVSFGGTPASSFHVDDDNTIHAMAANGASGKVSVTSPYGTGEMAGFTFLPPPVITSFTPQTGTVGTTVTITGTNFTGATTVYIGGELATSFTVLSPTTISAVAGAGLTGHIQVHTPDGYTVTTDDFTFTYAPPTITSFTPASATTNGTVTITGTNFYRVGPLTFGGVSAKNFVVNSPTSITATIGAGASGDVSISTPGGTATMPGFTYTLPPPVVSSASALTATKGYTVNISGNNFSTVTAVTFGGVNAASFIINSSTSITAIVGNGASGFIKVISPTGSDSTGYFTYYDPVITSFSPTSGATGTTVTITGTGFFNVSSVKFGDVAATSFKLNSPTSITAVVGAGNTGDVAVKTQVVTARLSRFTFVSPTAAITTVTPAVAAKGTTVKIAGYKFTGTTAVSFGNTPATSFVVNSDTEITAIVGLGASGDVSVTTPNGTATWQGFIYTTAPVITALSPDAAAVGAEVTISGFNFSASLTGNTVYFGSVKAPVLSATATSIVVAVPAGATYQPVTVTSNGLTGFSPNAFAVTFSTAGTLTAGSFAPKIDSATITTTNHIAISDLNLDGKNDVAVTAGIYSGGQINLYKNGSTPGVIALPAKTIINNNKVPQQTKFADLDGDGYLDLIAPNGVDGTGIAVFRNRSTGGNFLFDSEFSLSESSLANYEVGSGDLDGDGKVDLVVISPYSSKVYIYKNQSTPGSLSFVMTPITKSFTDFANDLVITDMDRDGKPDLVIVTSATLYILRNTSISTAISFDAVTSYTTAGNAVSLAAGDLDNDGRTDLVVTNSYSRTISLFHNISSPGKMALETKVDLITGSISRGICMANIDGNNKTDVIIANNDKSYVSVYKNTSALNVISFDPPFQVTTDNSPYAVTVGDLDNDGRPDILTANSTANTFSIIRNQVDGYFVTAFTPTSGQAQTVVTIKGTHFTTATGVQFGGKAAASFTIINDTTISAVIGDGNTGSVQVTWPGTTAALPLFTYIFPVPTITAFTPTSGTSGTTVTITGTNFTGATTVSFGGTAAASFTVNSATSITAIVASGASGNVSVTTPGGTASLAGFTYSSVTAVSNPVTANSKDLTIQPNPGRTIITVQHPASFKNAYLKFVDLLGRSVKQITPEINAKQTIINVSDLPQGVYQVIWSDGTKTLARSLIIN